MMVQQEPSLSTTLLGSRGLHEAWGAARGQRDEDTGRGTRRSSTHLVADHAVVGQTQVGVGTVPELEGTLVQLRDGLVHIQDGVLLGDLPDHLGRSRR